MKIAFISRSTLYSTPGGDTKQIDMTAKYLRALGVQVDIYLSNQAIRYEYYDLLHFFNIIRPADIIFHIKKSQKPYVVSTIFLDYGSFEKNATRGLRHWINKFFSEDSIEYLKAVARRVKNKEKIVSADYWLWGHRRSVLYVADRAAMLLPNSHSEYNRFAGKYKKSYNYRVVPNGIDAGIAEKVSAATAESRDKVLSVARIEGRKNQLNFIRAMNNTGYQVFIHGKPSPNNIGYYEQCKNVAAPNIHFSSWLEEDELYRLYNNSKVHVLPSYFETTGLSSLEAAAMGCNVVITDRGDTREYFGDNAWYCDPDNPASIRDAVDKAFNATYDNNFRSYILAHYTWSQAANETLKAYREVLQD